MTYRFMKFCYCNEPCAMSLMFMCSDFTRPPSSSCSAWAQLRLQHCTGLIGVVSTLAVRFFTAQKKQEFLKKLIPPPLYNPPLTPFLPASLLLYLSSSLSQDKRLGYHTLPLDIFS